MQPAIRNSAAKILIGSCVVAATCGTTKTNCVGVLGTPQHRASARAARSTPPTDTPHHTVAVFTDEPAQYRSYPRFSFHVLSL